MLTQFMKPGKYKSRLRLKVITSCVMALLTLACACIGIFHSHRHYSFNMVLWITIGGLLSIVAQDSIWFNHRRWQKLMSFLFIMFVGGPIAVLVIILHNVYIDKQLSGHEINTKGVVRELYERRAKKSSTPYALFSYQVNGKTWTQEMINKDNSLEVGDTVKLVCSELDPEIFVYLNH